MVTLETLIINASADLRATLDPIRGEVALLLQIAAFRPGDIDSPLASAKTAMRRLLYPSIQLENTSRSIEPRWKPVG